MPGIDTFRLADRLFDGHLTEKLAEWRREGLTIADIQFRLRTEHDLNVSVTTVWRWISKIDEAA